MSEPSKRCVNCNTERYGIHRSGYCRRCYPPVLQKRQVDRWDPKVPSTLKGLPKGGFKPVDDNPNYVWGYGRIELERELPKFKRNRLKELDARLFLLKTHESQRNENIDGLDIEHALRDLARWSGGKEDVVYGIASEVDHYFGQEAKRALFGWLIDIEESARWRFHRYWHLLDQEY